MGIGVFGCIKLQNILITLASSEMDFDPYSEMAEEAAFEDNYAAEMELMREMEELPSAQDSDDLKSNQSRRKLFENEQPSTSAVQDSSLLDILESELFIDEDDDLMPSAKRPRLDMIRTKPSHKLPTTLDEDLDEIKIKNESQEDDDSDKMIQRILNFRNRKAHEAEEFLQTSNQMSRNAVEKRRILEKRPLEGQCISATPTHGSVCYMRINDDSKSLKGKHMTNLMQGVSLLPQSVSEMRQELMVEQDNQTLHDSHSIVQAIRSRNLDGGNVENSTEFNDAQKFENLNDDNDIDISNADKIIANELWLDRFAPTQYPHLLSDEHVNRSLLKWLKMWDFVVFGRKVKKKEEPPQDVGNLKKFNYFQKWAFDDRTDEYERPFFKAALLHGPPGLGKTTLAHIIAKHAGYHVVEMNASDDRSAQVFRNKLEETTQMKSVLGHDERPNCLIIDEIDGAPQATIDVLLNTMNKSRQKAEKKIGKRKKQGSNNILVRPIICICNDLYVPALRQLRQQSFIVNFPPTRSSILASRLAHLCRVQQLHCDITTLLRLCEKTDNDIRSCVNTLQFVKASGQDKLSVSAISAFQIGQKDQHKSMFKVWQEIFQLPKNKLATERQRNRNSHHNLGENSSVSTRFYHIQHLVSANGEYEKTFQGVYENYLKVKFKDHTLVCVVKAHEWIELYDRLSYLNTHLQDWSVMKFYPYLFVMFHMLFSCTNVPKIAFPTQSYENSKKTQRSENILKGMFLEMSPQVRCYSTPHTIVTDSVPYILSIIAPTLRPVNSQLYTAAEKKVLEDVVSVMISYNLSYKQVRDEDGRYDYQLEPSVTEVCEYAEAQQSNKLSYSTRQLIAKEVEMEKMRRFERAGRSVSVPDNVKPAEPEKTEEKQQLEIKTLKDTLSQAKKPAEKPVIDFFCQFKRIKRPATATGSEAAKKPVRDPGIGNSQIWYKFNEGYSNAVRQTVYVKDLL